MGDSYFGKVRARASSTSTGTNAATSATIAAPATDTAARRWFVTGIQVSGDTACIVTIESPASTILWRKRATAAFAFSEAFPPGTIMGAVGAAVLVKISASTSNCEANLQAMLV